MKDSADLTIGRFAQATGVNVETIRYYQRRGLLPEPPRLSGRIRRYGQDDVRRMNFIKGAQRMGFSLGEVSDLLRLDDGAHCTEASALATEKLSQVRETLASLQQVERVLAGLVDACRHHDGDVRCPLIESLHKEDSLDSRD